MTGHSTALVSSGICDQWDGIRLTREHQADVLAFKNLCICEYRSVSLLYTDVSKLW